MEMENQGGGGGGEESVKENVDLQMFVISVTILCCAFIYQFSLILCRTIILDV